MGTWKRAGALAAALSAIGIGQAGADDYPSKQIEIIVPFGAGGGGDTSQRIFNKHAEPLVGQPLPVTNKPGAGGVIGWAEALQATPDGYLLTAVTSPRSPPARAREATSARPAAARTRNRFMECSPPGAAAPRSPVVELRTRPASPRLHRAGFR